MEPFSSLKVFQGAAAGVATGALLLLVTPPLWLLFLGAGKVLSVEEIWFQPKLQLSSILALVFLAVIAPRIRGTLPRRLLLPATGATVFWILLASALSVFEVNLPSEFAEAFFLSLSLGLLDGTIVIVFAVFFLSSWLITRNQPSGKASKPNTE